MPRQELIERVQTLSREAMHLANAANGNADLFDALLKADTILMEATTKARS